MKKSVTKPDFRKIMWDYFRTPPSMGSLVDSVFEAFDSDNSGDVDFKEMVTGLAMLAGNTHTHSPGHHGGDNPEAFESRVEFFFQLWDKDGSGSIETDELICRLSDTNDETFSQVDALVARWQNFDKDGDGKIDLAEFRAAMIEDDSAVTTFTRLFHRESLGSMVLNDDTGTATVSKGKAAAEDETWDDLGATQVP